MLTIVGINEDSVNKVEDRVNSLLYTEKKTPKKFFGNSRYSPDKKGRGRNFQTVIWPRPDTECQVWNLSTVWNFLPLKCICFHLFSYSLPKNLSTKNHLFSTIQRIKP